MPTLDLGYPTEVTATGEGPAVVLVHGTPLDSGSWGGVAPALAQGRRVVTYDLRGHGSARATELPPSYEVLVADVVRLLDVLGIERAHVVGHSFGGQIAQSVALGAPERTTSLWVVCARLTPFPAFAAAADEIGRHGMADVGPAAIARWFTPEAIASDESSVRYARDALGCAVPASFATALRMISDFDSTPRLPDLELPLRVIAAERDLVATPHDLRAAAERAPDSSFQLVTGAGHMLPVEQPERLGPFLAELPSA